MVLSFERCCPALAHFLREKTVRKDILHRSFEPESEEEEEEEGSI